MVESLAGEGVQTKVIGMLARSMLRAASRLLLRVEQGTVLATRADDEGCSPI